MHTMTAYIEVTNPGGKRLGKVGLVRVLESILSEEARPFASKYVGTRNGNPVIRVRKTHYTGSDQSAAADRASFARNVDSLTTRLRNDGYGVLTLVANAQSRQALRERGVRFYGEVGYRTSVRVPMPSGAI
jgi:hypothetical protein